MKRLVVGIALFGAMSALAQVPPDAGRILRDVEKPRPTLPQKPPPRLELDQPERPALAPRPDLRFRLTDWRFTGNTAFSSASLRHLLYDYLGRETSFAQLEEAAAKITRHYREHGYPVARAYLPQQEIRDGVVEIAILEGRLGKVELNNKSRVSDATIARHLDGLTGEVIRDDRLERKLLLLSDLAGIGTASAALRPGERVGESALALGLGEARAASVLLEADNYGSYFSGEYRIAAELGLASLAGQGDLLSARVMVGTPDLDFVRLGYQLPLGGNGWRLGAAYSYLSYRLGEDFTPLQAHGNASSGEATVSYPFVRSRAYNVVAQLGYTHRKFDDRIDATASETGKTSDVGRLGLSGDWRDSLGGGAVSTWSLAWSRGRLEIDTPLAHSIDDATLRTQGEFDKANLSLLRAQRLADRFSALGMLSGQVASKNLDSSEKFALGGPYGVRGFPVGEAPADEGVLGNAELRYDFIPAALQGAVFADAGYARLSRNPLPAAGSNTRSLSSAGAGLNWTERAFTARGMVAWPSERATSAPDRRPRVWAQLAYRL